MKNIKLALIWGVILLLSACQPDGNKKYINVGMVDGWAEGVAMTYVAKAVLEEMGYQLVIQRATPDMILASMNNGDTDLYMDVWLPLTHGSKIAKFPNLVDIGTSYAHARNGLVVPDYVPINSIEELKTHVDQFNHQIMGIEKGAGITAAVDRTLKDYDLNYLQVNSSTVAMITELQNAIKEKRWIVVAAWQPHWMFGKMKLKFLEDPRESLGTSEQIKIFTRKQFPTEQPELTRFFSQVHFDVATMANLLMKMEESKDKESTAKQWVAEHRSLVNSWLR
ncbi:glycine/betaine ABC transporter [Sphingobacterium faecium NBRC 15299]|jgi:glycine betaine/proline transport system substrate-binding protein|uniref:glycine betaine ABC transporter substrate-binding protein n=1 Tax=Sphingobacterium faecium TaxID=34087 RepID=UPI000D3BC35F|nr:glycine betaine ABC transporter substrate-binding protein [Sphingobacterium faecium]PTX11542.1 glycine betaine/proline transport system substrate-binding protein [Sphingobacterium faecium]GEM64587.1 glycine/betaine ABC transporter [Sphingobacterium faecium NBRC 15299]